MTCIMDERCAVLERFGATFYANIEDCPDILKSLKEGIKIGRKYESLLKKMEDYAPKGYVDMWLDSL
jgi:predicted metal-binding protein